MAAFRKSLELNPAIPAIHHDLARVHLAQGQLQQALAEMQREPDALWRLFTQALVYEELGSSSAANAALTEFVAGYREDSAFQIATAYAFRREGDKAFEWLEKAYSRRDTGLSDVKVDPLLNNIRSDTRYRAFLTKMRLPL
jgi:tetratricopeptide (TPR) repeat protein